MIFFVVSIAVSNAALAMGVFTWLVRPESGARVVARLTGRGEAWDHDELSAEEEAGLMEAARAVRPWLVLFLFFYSFASGVLMTAARL